MPAQAFPFVEEAALGVSINGEDGEFSLRMDFAQIESIKMAYGADVFVALAIRYIEDACRHYDLADDEELWIATVMNHLVPAPSA
ncbi:hypothetical protein [Microvirga puerhi]|uniref:Uncharacterized protein n=1 Tax=Microvirga puerhi TaxID=2876078 RepID=A0ABS7VS51_9HYPH|nr:hypothetical protein [Microvirga puerhi]MBZ6078039.1 hypothetical protein [Microvirga puerhi]